MRSLALDRLRRAAGPRLAGLLGDGDNAAMAAASIAGFAIRAAGVVLMTAVTALLTRLVGPACPPRPAGSCRATSPVATLFALPELALIPPLGAVGAAVATSTAALSWNARLYLLARRLAPVDTCILRQLRRERRAAAA